TRDFYDNGRIVKGVNPKERRLFLDERLPIGIFRHFSAYPVDHISNVVEVGCIRNSDYEVDFGELIGQIGNGFDFTVRYVVHGAVFIAQDGDPKRNVFHSSCDASYGYHILDAVLVFKNDEEACDDIAHQVLTPEADSHAQNTGSRQDGGYVY